MGLLKRSVACSLFIVALLGTIVYVVGFATAYWQVESDGGHEGLWENCHVDICTPKQTRQNPGWLSGVQTLLSFGLILLVVNLMLSSMLACGLPVPRQRLTKAVITLAILTILFISLGIVIYAVKARHDISYSFSLCACATVTCVFTAVLTAVLQKLSSEW